MLVEDVVDVYVPPGMFSHLKRSLTDLRLHGFNNKQVLRDESSSQSGRSEARIKRSSSSNNMKHSRLDMRISPTPTIVDCSRETQPLLDHQDPISESGLPSPQHTVLTQQESAGEENHLAVSRTTATTGSSHYTTPGSLSPLSHSIVPPRSSQIAASSVIPSLHGTSTNQGEKEDREKVSHCCSNCGYARGYGSDINSRIDRLSRHLESLENSVATDVRLILALLRQQGMKTAGSMPDPREPSWLESSVRARPSTVQRSSSVPQNSRSLHSSSALCRSSTQEAPVGDAVAATRWPPCPSPRRQNNAIPRRSQSQPVDVSQQPTPHPQQQDESAWSSVQLITSNVPERSSDSDPWRMDVSSRRRQFFSNRSSASDEAVMLEFPVAPIARLDSLHELDGRSTKMSSSSSSNQLDSKSSQV